MYIQTIFQHQNGKNGSKDLLLVGHLDEVKRIWNDRLNTHEEKL